MNSANTTNLGIAPLVSFRNTLAGRIVLPVAASLFVAVCAHAIVPLPFTPVPLTLGDLAVILVGLMLGPVAGFSALALYLLEGALGLPVFSPAGPGGIAQLFGATGGFLIAYPFAAALAGGLFRILAAPAQGSRARFAAALLSAVAGSTLLMVSGAAWLMLFLHLNGAGALAKGVLPFLPGQLVKVVSAAGIVTSLKSWRQS